MKTETLFWLPSETAFIVSTVQGLLHLGNLAFPWRQLGGCVVVEAGQLTDAAHHHP